MADRSLRGMRLGTQSLQSEVGVEFSPRRKSVYRAADGTIAAVHADANPGLHVKAMLDAVTALKAKPAPADGRKD